MTTCTPSRSAKYKYQMIKHFASQKISSCIEHKHCSFLSTRWLCTAHLYSFVFYNANKSFQQSIRKPIQETVLLTLNRSPPNRVNHQNSVDLKRSTLFYFKSGMRSRSIHHGCFFTPLISQWQTKGLEQLINLTNITGPH